MKDDIKNKLEAKLQGLIQDIFIFEQNIPLVAAISESAPKFDVDDDNYSPTFIVIQNTLNRDAILSVARIYDQSSNKNETRCLDALLKYLNKDDIRGELHDISSLFGESDQLKMILNSADAPQLIDYIHSDCFPVKLKEFFEVKRCEQKKILDNLRKFRDKRLAHNDSKQKGMEVDLKSLEPLIKIAKDLVGIIGWTYLNTVYILNGQYRLTNNARGASRGFKRFMEFIEPGFYNRKSKESRGVITEATPEQNQRIAELSNKTNRWKPGYSYKRWLQDNLGFQRAHTYAQAEEAIKLLELKTRDYA